jgi:hypothetical protein
MGVRIVAKATYYVLQASPSIRPHVSSRFPTARISMKSYTARLHENLSRKKTKFGLKWEKVQVEITRRPKYVLLFQVTLNRHKSAVFE